ncbi:unnamed protein product [Dicrocoelium dendriticum]|nr:unnamed protein product [Dicrocoelium dendriticum]
MVHATSFLVLLLIIAIPSNAQVTQSVISKLPKAEFDACVKRCGDQHERCSSAVKDLWLNFKKNKKKIMNVIVKCCLAGESDRTKPASTSFATCVRDNCRAQMWGCNIKKRHTGFLSEDEKKTIIEKERERDQKSHQM